jgi:soluble lytic murein transglycosylase-like protein
MPSKISWDDPAFKEVSDYYGLEVEYLQAVVRIESNGQYQAFRWETHILDYSLGLCQVLTSTAAWMLGNSGAFPIPQAQWKTLSQGIGQAVDLGTKSLNRAMIDPLVALHLGAAYLSYQLKRYDGDIQDAIAAYNAGSARRTSTGEYVNQHHVDKFNEALTYFRERADEI